MRKYGKYEKKPGAKVLLMQTYLSSLLCLVLCVSMFFGTSYAWFTSEVNNSGNEIYIGILDVELDKKVGDGWKSLDSSKNDANNEPNDLKLFNKNIRWEPGYTALETIRITNTGDLAFNYVLRFTDGKLEKEGMDLATVAKNFEVWVCKHANPTIADDGTMTYPAAPAVPNSFQEIKEGGGWKLAGTLDKILAGDTVLNGAIDSFADAPSAEGISLADLSADTYYIALHMKEETKDTSIMGQKILLNVQLTAYQKSAEIDGLDNPNYDAVNDAAALKDALNGLGYVQLDSNVTITSAEDRLTMAGGQLEGNNNLLIYNGGRGNGESSLGVLTTYGGTIEHLNVKGGEDGRALYVTNLNADLHVKGCNLSGAYAFNLNSAESFDYGIYFHETTFASWTSFASGAKRVEFEDCTFTSTLRPYGAAEGVLLKDCVFSGGGNLDVSCLEDGKTITLSSCVIDGLIVESAEITKTSEGLTVNNTSLTIVNGTVTWKSTQNS